MPKGGYTKGQEAWRVAEDLGFDNAPKQMLKRLLDSPATGKICLRRSFRDIVWAWAGARPRENLDDSKFATYTIVFAWRRDRD